MILPFFPFLLFGEPDRSMTQSPPVFFSIIDEADGTSLEAVEFCHGTVANATIDFSEIERRQVVNIELNDAMKLRFAEITTRYVGYVAELTLEGRVLVAPRIMEPLTNGSFQITGVDTIAQAERVLQAVRGQCTTTKADTE
ncbi:MAG: hypothetical protein WBA51_03275 [Erythrobacter sp.]